MTALPLPILSHLGAITREQHRFAYLLFKADGSLLECNGALDAFGIEHISSVNLPESPLSFLSDLLPLHGEQAFLPHVEVTPNHYANIHMFSDTRIDWVLLLDVSEEHGKQQRLLQKVNDLALLREETLGKVSKGTTTIRKDAQQQLLKLYKEPKEVDATVVSLSLLPEKEFSISHFELFSGLARNVLNKITNAGGWVEFGSIQQINAVFGLYPTTLPALSIAFSTVFEILEELTIFDHTWGLNEVNTSAHIGIAISKTIVGTFNTNKQVELSIFGEAKFKAQQYALQATKQSIVTHADALADLPLNWKKRFTPLENEIYQFNYNEHRLNT